MSDLFKNGTTVLGEFYYLRIHLNLTSTHRSAQGQQELTSPDSLCKFELIYCNCIYQKLSRHINSDNHVFILRLKSMWRSVKDCNYYKIGTVYEGSLLQA